MAFGLMAFGLLATDTRAMAGSALTLSWTNNLLTVRGDHIPGGPIEIWYLEAFCRTGARDRNWRETTRPHKTTLVSRDKKGRRLRFHTRVEPNVEVRHEVRAGKDELDFRFTLVNHGDAAVNIDWFQPACIRVARFTGRDQAGYTERSFIFTERGLTPLAQTRRTEEAIYRGGQVFVPRGIPLEDANPRPHSLDAPVNGLIGCWSADDQYLLATASDVTHELFEGVYVCLHSDPHIGGLKPGETKKVRAKVYLMKNDVNALLRRYRRDFGSGARF